MFSHDPARLEATLTLADLIEIYCVSKRTIWRWVAEGRIPGPYAITRRIRRWKASEIQQHLDGLQRTVRTLRTESLGIGPKSSDPTAAGGLPVQ
jgi:predicted DNA-binding transcriptional regulator AlpA